MGCHPWPRAWQKRGSTAAGSVHNDIDGRGGGTAMDVGRHAAPHVGTCVVVPSSWTNDTPIFRTREALWKQRVRVCAKLVIFAHVSTVTRELRWDCIRPWCLPADVHVDVLHWLCRGSILPHLVFIPL